MKKKITTVQERVLFTFKCRLYYIRVILTYVLRTFVNYNIDSLGLT